MDAVLNEETDCFDLWFGKNNGNVKKFMFPADLLFLDEGIGTYDLLGFMVNFGGYLVNDVLNNKEKLDME